MSAFKLDSSIYTAAAFRLWLFTPDEVRAAQGFSDDFANRGSRAWTTSADCRGYSRPHRRIDMVKQADGSWGMP